MSKEQNEQNEQNEKKIEEKEVPDPEVPDYVIINPANLAPQQAAPVNLDPVYNGNTGKPLPQKTIDEIKDNELNQFVNNEIPRISEARSKDSLPNLPLQAHGTNILMRMNVDNLFRHR